MEAKPDGKHLEKGDESGLELMIFGICTVQPIIYLQNQELTY